MCGITGILTRRPEEETSKKVRRATGSLQHRGPESEGYWTNIDDTISLGHRRLCIIDLSKQAAQPMHCLGRYVIVYNGEVYNYIELRNQLRQKGYVFLSESDTEVIAAAYDAFGAECVQQFEGM